ncbi:calcium/sodium antiporter [Halovulum dunhuangense]|uniref:Calcium/sodium antiporter n=1 Tax=Halovulum dunhuangense TaxID=1505036 RepID=A0A849KV10_9RHOB|nr:calcium/sodium antiporter [Halovulum dunhuangense]NNU78865.1 calcium/sodium antiporter [Halovulum dunhuangense]
MTYILFLAGFVALVIGGDLLVRGAVAIATRLGLSPLLIGLTLVGFGTSAPELVTSLQAGFSGSPGIAVGNVVGSNIANILLILGVAAAIAPVHVDGRAFRRDGPALGLATLALFLIVLVDGLGRLAGMGLLLGLAGYLFVAYRQERNAPDPEGAESFEGGPIWRSLLFFVVGLVLVILGARWLVAAAIDIATTLGVSETVIGLTVVAIGTSLPELVTTLVAAIRKQADIAFGNVVGSNIYNILGILGTVGVVIPLDVPDEIIRFDIWVVLAATAAMFLFTRTGWKITRGEGIAMLAAYGAYLGYLAVTA